MNKTKIEWAHRSTNPIYAVRTDTGKRGWHCEKPVTRAASTATRRQWAIKELPTGPGVA